MRRAARLLLAPLCALCMSCATLKPAVSAPEEVQAPAQAAPALNVELLEGRPNGLLLRLRVSPEAKLPAGTRLTLWRLRAPDDEEGVPLLEQTLDAEGQRRESLEGEGLGVLDAQPGAPGATIYYILRAAPPAPAPLLASAPLITRWRQPAAPPAGLRALADLPGVIELRWAHQPGCQTLIFRRTLDDSKDPRPARLAQLSEADGGAFVDRGVEPGAIYAYRLACVIEDERGALFYGRASGELFVAAWAPEPEPEAMAPEPELR